MSQRMTLSPARLAIFAGIAAVLLTAAQIPAIADVAWSITNLGVLAVDDQGSVAEGMNDLGQVVGNDIDSGGLTHLFFWDPDTGMTDLGAPVDYTNPGCRGVNDSGQVIADGFSSGWHALLAVPDGSGGWQWQDLGNLGRAQTHAYGINDSGQVVGVSQTTGGSLDAFLWSSDGGMLDLWTAGTAQGINDNGDVVGAYQDSTGKHACVWSGGDLTTLADLGGVNSSGKYSSIGMAINIHGEVAGQSLGGDGASHACLWLADGTAIDLQALLPPVAYLGSSAIAINDDGEVIGSDTLNSGSHPTEYWIYSDGTIRFLDTLPLDTPGWSGLFATCINNQGQIAGGGVFADPNYGFLLTPPSQGGTIPEPGTLALMLVGLPLGLLRRRRRSP